MRIGLDERFQRDVRNLDDAGRAVVFDVILALPAAIGDVHRHQGLGIRKLHRSGIWEARIGLGLRLVFTVERDAEKAWRLYMLLTRVEDAFRDMKSPLSERPIFHHLQHRVETHIFLCVLAYHLLVAVENTLLHNGEHTSWRTVREALETHQICTVVLPTDSGAILRIRRGSVPEAEPRRLYELLGVPLEVMRPQRSWLRADSDPDV